MQTPFEFKFNTPIALQRHYVIGNTPNGHGAVNTKIRRWTNVSSEGTALEYTDSANSGMSIAVNKAGIYAVSYTDSKGAGASQLGWSLNSSQLATAIGSINVADRILMTSSAAASPTSVSAIVLLSLGDTLRTHTDGNPDTATGVGQFRVVYLGP